MYQPTYDNSIPRHEDVKQAVEEYAHCLLDSGISTIPIKADGSKAPAIASWKPYQSRRPTPDEISAWYHDGTYGLAAIAGKVSGNLEIIDIDEPKLVEPFKQAVENQRPGLIGRLVQTVTPSDGAHFYYRHDDESTRNQKLAEDERTNGQGERAPYTLIETRGEGGYAIIPPSPAACHPDHKPYRFAQGDLATVPTITADERSILLHTARDFNAYLKPTKDYNRANNNAPRPSKEHPYSRRSLVAGDDRPGSDYNARGEWGDLLPTYGWTVVYTRDGVTYWRRPGKEYGISATTDYAGSDLLYVFSSNAAPFESETAYSLFAALTMLAYNGDYAEAARALSRQGYGEPPQQRGIGISETGQAVRRLSAPRQRHGHQLPLLTRPVGLSLGSPTRPTAVTSFDGGASW